MSNIAHYVVGRTCQIIPISVLPASIDYGFDMLTFECARCKNTVKFAASI